MTGDDDNRIQLTRAQYGIHDIYDSSRGGAEFRNDLLTETSWTLVVSGEILKRASSWVMDDWTASAADDVT